MDNDFKESLVDDAIACAELVERLKQKRDYDSAIEILTKIILLREFETCSLVPSRISSAPYMELAGLYELNQDRLSGLRTLERYFCHPNRQGNADRKVAMYYLKLSRREHYTIPENIVRKLKAVFTAALRPKKPQGSSRNRGPWFPGSARISV